MRSYALRALSGARPAALLIDVNAALCNPRDDKCGEGFIQKPAACKKTQETTDDNAQSD